MEYALVYAMMNKDIVDHESQEVYFKERQTDGRTDREQTDRTNFNLHCRVYIGVRIDE